MDQKPSTSKPECLSPTRKRPLNPFIASEKLMVRNVYKYVWKEKASECIAEYDFKMNITNKCVEKTADILGISTASVYRILREHKRHQEFKSPNKSGPRYSFKDKLSKDDFEGIRRKIKEIENANETPTIKKVLKLVLDDPALPNFSMSTMKKIMAHLKNPEENNSNVPDSDNNDNEDSNDDDNSKNVTDGTGATFELIEVKVEYSENEDDSS